MSEIKKLLKAREKLVAQREWAIAGAKYYENVQLAAQASIRDIDQAIEKIQKESQQSGGIETTGKTVQRTKTPAKQNKPAKSDLPATGEAFWLSFLNHGGRRVADIFDDALVALKQEYQFSPSPDQHKKLRNRLAVALHGAISNKRVISTGSGRDRLYHLPKQ